MQSKILLVEPGYQPASPGLGTQSWQGLLQDRPPCSTFSYLPIKAITLLYPMTNKWQAKQWAIWVLSI